MPRYTIWIREEDDPKWREIKNRPNWIHAHLNGFESQQNTNKALEMRDIYLIVTEREKAKQLKDWVTADVLRDEARKQGALITDLPKGKTIDYMGETLSQTWKFSTFSPPMGPAAWIKLTSRVPKPKETHDSLRKLWTNTKCKVCGIPWLSHGNLCGTIKFYAQNSCRTDHSSES